MAEGAVAPKFWSVSEITNTGQISAITSTELVRNQVDDRATMSQKSSLPQVTRFVSEALMPDRPAVIVIPSTGRTHERTRPPQEHQKALANRRPSTHATELSSSEEVLPSRLSFGPRHPVTDRSLHRSHKYLPQSWSAFTFRNFQRLHAF